MPQQEGKNPLPVETFANLIPVLSELVNNLATSDQPNIEETAAAFREKVAQARTLVEALPGGDLSLNDQDEVIRGLRELKRSKLMQLGLFREAPEGKGEDKEMDAAGE